MKKLAIAILAVALGAGVASAADPIAERKAIMKQNGRSMGQLSAIAKGEQPFDQATVDAALSKLAGDAKAFDVSLFPPETMTGDTTASPKIWEDMAGFQAAIDKFRADTEAAAAAKPADAAALGAQLGVIGQNCGGCHKPYRISKG